MSAGESTPLLDKRPDRQTTNVFRALIAAAIVIVSLVGALVTTRGGTQLLQRAGHSIQAGPGQPVFNLFFNSNGAGAEFGYDSYCDFAACADADPVHGVYSFVDVLRCLGGAPGKIGVLLLIVFSNFAPRS
jgi:hypothetical protein